MVMSRPEIAAVASAPAVAVLSKQPRQPISRKRVDTVISRSVAWFGIVFGLQAVPALLDQYSLGQPLWAAITVGVLFGSLLFALLCSTLKRFVVGSHRVVAGVYVLALVTWPLFLADPEVAQRGDHWLYQLTTVATAMAAIGVSGRWASDLPSSSADTIRRDPGDTDGGGARMLGIFNLRSRDHSRRRVPSSERCRGQRRASATRRSGNAPDRITAGPCPARDGVSAQVRLDSCTTSVSHPRGRISR